MPPIPLYTLETMREPAYQLRFGWTGWTAGPVVARADLETLFSSLDPVWETDGLRRLEHRIIDGTWQITFSAKPSVPPVFLASRVKGRLQHALRRHSSLLRFSRKLAVRSIGDNTSAEVEAYIARQVDKHAFVDARFREQMREFTVAQHGVDLAEPTATESGRYWYNLHVVLVVVERQRIADRCQLTIIRDT